MKKGYKRSLFSLYLAYFADYLSWGVAIAFLAVYIDNESSPFKNLFWAPQISLGCAFAAFPIGELIGSPILGDLSEWVGRKKMLIWGFWGSIFSMLLSAYSLWAGNFALFLITQLLVGFFSGKQGMAQIAIVEMQEGTKGQKLAFFSVIGGLAWIIGPFMGGWLLEEPYILYGGYIWPSLLAATIYLFSLLFTKWFYIDTYEPQNQRMGVMKFFHSVGDTFNVTWREKPVSIFFFNLIGWYLLIVSLSNFLADHLPFFSGRVAIHSGYFSLVLTIVGILGTAWILHRYKEKSLLFWILLLSSSTLFLLYHSDRILELWTYLAIPAITEAWIYPAYQAILSGHMSEQNQGKLFSLVGATNGSCQLVASLILSGIPSMNCILVAALLFISSAALLPALFKKRFANVP